jgi:hypothetical protein
MQGGDGGVPRRRPVANAVEQRHPTADLPPNKDPEAGLPPERTASDRHEQRDTVLIDPELEEPEQQEWRPIKLWPPLSGGIRLSRRPERRAGQTGDSAGDLFDEIPDVSNRPPPFRQDIGHQREVVNLPIPQVKITPNSAGFQALRHEFGVREQQLVGTRVDGDRRQRGQIRVHRRVDTTRGTPPALREPRLAEIPSEHRQRPAGEHGAPARVAVPEFPGRIRVREGRDGGNPSRVHQVSADGGERGHEREISPGRVARYHDLVAVVAAVPQPAKSAQSVFDRISYRVRRQLAVPHGKNTGVGRLRQTDHQGTVRIEAAGEERPTVETEDRASKTRRAREPIRQNSSPAVSV